MGEETFRVAVIGSHSHDMRHGDWPEFADVAALLASGRHDVVVVDQSSPEAAVTLERLRRHPDYAYSLIYLARQPAASEQALSDGRLPGAEQLRQDVKVWLQRYEPLAPKLEDFSLESRLLFWLWVGPGRTLRAFSDARQPELYIYPVLEALKPVASQRDGFWTIRFVTEQGWIRPGPLIDRVRLCPPCGSGHLNYVDVCTECQSLSIARQRSLHCFVCGHVGPQEQFTKDRGLFCPNCLSQLRHIGSDYDRPMENYRCTDCNAFFVDAMVQVRCLDCSDVHTPDQLSVREIHDYALTEAGHLYCRQGLVGKGIDVGSRFNFQGLLASPAFVELVDWLLDLEKRYQRSVFSLVGIRLTNLEQELHRLGERRAYALLDTVVNRLVEIIRDTDRCMRSSEDTIWLLLPETDAKGATKLTERLVVLMTDFEENGADVDVRITKYTAPHDRRENEDATLLLSRLRGELLS